MTFCLVVVYITENIFSYGHNLKIPISGNGSHLRTLDFNKIFQKVISIAMDKLLTYNLVNRVAVLIPIAMLNKIYENITDIEWVGLDLIFSVDP